MSARGKGKGKGKSGTKKVQPECWFVITVGLPGSGKSVFSKSLESRGWVRASQDDLGTQDEVRKVIEKALKHRKSVVLDRCCVQAKERRMWLQQVRDCDPPVTCESVFFDVSADECKQRVMSRTGHPNLQGEGSGEVIDDFARSLEPPQEREGFSKVFVAKTMAEANSLARAVGSYPICVKGV